MTSGTRSSSQRIFRALVVLAAAGVSVLTAACGTSEVQLPDNSRQEIAQSAARLSNARIFFAHQSVGQNIVDGMRALENGISGPKPEVLEASTAPAREGGVFVHAKLGRNGDPKGKTDAFVAALESGLGQRVDVAFQKYCYADFDAQTDARAVFDHYRQGIERIRHDFPRLTIVHVTAPLTIVQGGPKAWVKRVLGRTPDHYEDNIVREAFNDMLRHEYGGREPLFDLAALESSRAGGAREPIVFGPSKVYALLPEYSSDGSHLNVRAQQYVAGRLLSFLAEVVQHRGPGGASIGAE